MSKKNHYQHDPYEDEWGDGSRIPKAQKKKFRKYRHENVSSDDDFDDEEYKY